MIPSFSASESDDDEDSSCFDGFSNNEGCESPMISQVEVRDYKLVIVV
jgi:hypothetical protein